MQSINVIIFSRSWFWHGCLRLTHLGILCELLLLLLLVRSHYKLGNQPGISKGYPHRQRNLYMLSSWCFIPSHLKKSYRRPIYGWNTIAYTGIFLRTALLLRTKQTVAIKNHIQATCHITAAKGCYNSVILNKHCIWSRLL